MLNDYRQIIAAITSSPWLITQDSMNQILEIVNMRLRGEAFSDEEIRLRLEEARDEEKQNPRVEVGGGVGVISMYGPMFPKSNLMTELSGATSLEAFRNDLGKLLQDDSVKSIVLDMDTPGGEASMVPETGRVIKEASEVKPIYAVANTLAASGGLWLGSQATKFYSTESGKVGSLGVYHPHEDRSRRDEAEGTKITFISAGKYKTAGNPHEPLSEDAKEYFQEHVDELYGDFVAAVADGRGISEDKVLSDFGDGRVLTAKQALKVGMIDGIVSLDDFLDELVTENAESNSSSLTLAVQRMHGGQVLDNKEGGKSRIRTLVDSMKGGSDVKTEHAPEEHADPPNPGEDAPTNQSEKDRALGDEGGAGGSRRDTPPIEEEVKVMSELGKELRTRLELAEDASDEEVTKAVEQMSVELAPIREAQAAQQEKATFAEKFPTEHAKLQKLEKESQENEAKAFAQKYERFVKTVGDKKVESTVGFSTITLEKIEETHKNFAEGTANVNDLIDLLDSIAESGFVDYREVGSSRRQDTEARSENAGKAFSEIVAEIQEKDKLSYAQAIAVATEKYPDDFAAYREQVSGARPRREDN